jgi:hypothetical protein
MDIYGSGRGKEYVWGGPRRLVTLTFDILRVAGTPAAADARIRVTSVRVVDRRAFFGLRPHRGEFGTLRLRRGIVTDSTTNVFYCAPAVDECDPISGVDQDPDPNMA